MSRPESERERRVVSLRLSTEELELLDGLAERLEVGRGLAVAYLLRERVRRTKRANLTKAQG